MLADELSRRLEGLRGTEAWRAYEDARRQVLAMKDAERAAAGAAAEPSAYWREELRELEYLLDASPLVVERLRRHTAHVTGLWAYQYRSQTGAAARGLERRLRALDERAGGRLGVPEAPELGGFGHRIDGGLYNLDTLKFHEALVALERAGVLARLRRLRRPVIWEVGSGWGGFAYQVKTLLPDATHVLVDLPELFLLSATYLRALFPAARVAFVGGSGGTAELADADFVFVSHEALEQPEVPRPDLVANMVSFQEMTSVQVRRYVHRAAEIGCPALYSLNRTRSPYNAELSSVPEILSERYELEEVRVLETDYTRPLPEGRLGRARAAAGRAAAGIGLTAYDPYRHLVGRLRAAVPSPVGPPAERAGA